MQVRMSTAFAASLTILIAVLFGITAQAKVSGIYKDRQETVDVSADGHGIVGIGSAKKDSSPCQLSIFEKALTGQQTPASEIILNQCSTIKSRSIVSAQFEQPNVFLRGVAVCLSKEGVRHLKPVWSGIKLYGAEVAGGVVTPLGDGHEVGFERFLCHDWQEPVLCGDGEIATGITAHVRKARVDDKQITGLGITCTTPQVNI